jgi:hypothetical protein
LSATLRRTSRLATACPNIAGVLQSRALDLLARRCPFAEAIFRRAPHKRAPPRTAARRQNCGQRMQCAGVGAGVRLGNIVSLGLRYRLERISARWTRIKGRQDPRRQPDELTIGFVQGDAGDAFGHPRFRFSPEIDRPATRRANLVSGPGTRKYLWGVCPYPVEMVAARAGCVESNRTTIHNHSACRYLPLQWVWSRRQMSRIR